MSGTGYAFGWLFIKAFFTSSAQYSITPAGTSSIDCEGSLLEQLAYAKPRSPHDVVQSGQ